MTDPIALRCSKPPRHGRGGRESGFTLIELMIVVAIVAILGAIAFASYTNNITATRRKAATACLVEQAQLFERHYTTNLTYVGANLAAGCRTDLTDFYTFSDPTAANTTATTYTLTATPKGQQSNKDSLCAVLGINHRGAKSKTGTGSVDDCW